MHVFTMRARQCGETTEFNKANKIIVLSKDQYHIHPDKEVTKMTNEDFIKLLKNHDWYYQYAEGEPYWKGRAELTIINNAKRDNPELQKIYDEYVEAMKNG